MIERVSSRGAGKLVKVSLRDVPLNKRRLHGRYLIEAARRDGDIEAAIAAEHAILFPSDRTYLVPVDAVVELLGVAPNGQGRKLTRVQLTERTWDIYDGLA